MLFVCTAVAQAGWGALVLTGPGRALLGGGVVLHASAVVAWFVSRTAGLPFGPHPGVAEPVGVADTTAAALGMLALAGAVRLLMREHRRDEGANEQAPPVAARVGFGALAASALAPMWGPAAATGGHHGAGHGLVIHLVALASMATVLIAVVAAASGSRPLGRQTERSSI